MQSGINVLERLERMVSYAREQARNPTFEQLSPRLTPQSRLPKFSANSQPSFSTNQSISSKVIV
ncbi:hypothetical protein [Candidatus Chlorohelix sp.]|uniref:hypothetical protein n=1 Tax=Candidatus Chlorohelix sp. TaxID=3139201 RepID=UPI00305BA039